MNVVGAWTGNVDELVYDRPGLFENTEIRTKIVSPFFRGLGADVDGQKKFPDIERCRIVAGTVAPVWRRNVRRILERQGFKGGPWVFVGSHSCTIWPIWRKAFPTAKWVIVRRDDDATIESCEKTGYMNGFSSRAGWIEWLNRYKIRFDQIRQSTSAVRDIRPQKMIDGYFNEARGIIKWIGLPWNEETVSDYFAPLNWKTGRFERDTTEV